MQNLTETTESSWLPIWPFSDTAGTGALAMGAGPGPIEPNHRRDSIAG